MKKFWFIMILSLYTMLTHAVFNVSVDQWPMGAEQSFTLQPGESFVLGINASNNVSRTVSVEISFLKRSEQKYRPLWDHYQREEGTSLQVDRLSIAYPHADVHNGPPVPAYETVNVGETLQITQHPETIGIKIHNHPGGLYHQTRFTNNGDHEETIKLLAC